MDRDQKILRMGAAALILGVLLRMAVSWAAPAFASGEALPVMLFLGTGRVVLPREPEPEQTVPPEVIPIPTRPPSLEQEPLVFTAADQELLEVHNVSGYDPAIGPLLTAPLELDLSGAEPRVLIFHTHACEGYVNTLGEPEDGNYRTRDEAHNMVAVGDLLTRLLTEGGISVLHDRTLHDYPSYNGSYNLARKTVQEYLQRYPSIRLILDLHRDAVEDSAGQQLAPLCRLEGQETARLMLVVGTGSGGLNHPDWQKNLSLALKLQVVLQRQAPELCRPLVLSPQRFNQDLAPGMLLIEVGAAGNTQEQAMAGVRQLAKGLLEFL